MSWRVYPAAAFERFAAAWDDLNRRMEGPPFLGSTFVGRALTLLGSGDEWLAVRGEPGREDAMGILREARVGAWQTFQPSQLPLGAWVMRRDLPYAEAVDGLFARLPRFPLVIGISQQDPAVHRSPGSRGAVQTLPYIRTGWIEVDGTFGDYWRGRGKHLRQNVRTQWSKLARQQITAVLDEITDPSHVPAAIAEYARLECAGWKAAHGTAVRNGNAQGRFYRAVMEDFCRAGAGRIFRLQFSGRTVAMDLGIEAHGRHVLLKSAYDESVHGFSPSTLLKRWAYERLFEHGAIRRIEFFGRYSEWTSRWTADARLLFHVNAFRWPTVRFLHGGMRVVGATRSASHAQVDVAGR